MTIDHSGNVWMSNNLLTASMNIDPNSQNGGNVKTNALTFGKDSGEGIASTRSGGNADDLEFYTGFNNRMTIDHSGNVSVSNSLSSATLTAGVVTTVNLSALSATIEGSLTTSLLTTPLLTSPSQQVEVSGNYLLVDGANGQEACIGIDDSASNVQVGSMNSNITTVAFWNHASGSSMHISCSSITILGGADLAEPFAIADPGMDIPQGAVVVIDDKSPGQLKMSNQPYDTRVAGVVSGANGISPGIQMQQQGLLEGGKNVALTGRVYVQADTCNGAIQPGDLLTTSSTPGRAMKVLDHVRAQGAILGKAMSGLKEGQGLVLVLVTLQ